MLVWGFERRGCKSFFKRLNISWKLKHVKLSVPNKISKQKFCRSMFRPCESNKWEAKARAIGAHPLVQGGSCVLNWFHCLPLLWICLPLLWISCCFFVTLFLVVCRRPSGWSDSVAKRQQSGTCFSAQSPTTIDQQWRPVTKLKVFNCPLQWCWIYVNKIWSGFQDQGQLEVAYLCCHPVPSWVVGPHEAISRPFQVGTWRPI